MSKNQFRTKFQKVFNPDSMVVEEFFDRILSETPKFVCGLIWKLTYDPRNIIFDPRYSILLDPMYSFGNVNILRNEIRYQYSLTFSSFLKVENCSDEVKQSYQELLKASDEITAYVVYSFCLKFSDSTQEEIERCLFLLQSPKENLFFGGVRTLGFWPVEADYLKPFASKIGKLLKAIVSEKVTANKITESATVTSDPEAVDSEVKSETSTNKVVPEEILKNRDLFNALVKSVAMIEATGFNREEVFQKYALIASFLEISKSF